MDIGVMIFAVGVLVYIVGNIWFLIVGFSESVLWGLAILVFGGLAGLLFAASHWDRAKGPVGLSIGGVLICLGGLGLGILTEAGDATPAPAAMEQSATPDGYDEPAGYEPRETTQERSEEPEPAAAPAPAPVRPAPAPRKPRKNPYSSGDTY